MPLRSRSLCRYAVLRGCRRVGGSPLKIDLEKISVEPCRWRDRESIPVAELDRPEVLALGVVTVDWEIAPTEDGYLLQAQFEYLQTLACMRCLKPIEIPTSNDTTLLLEIGRHLTNEAELQLRQEDLNTLILETTTLDTQPILVEQLQLNIPMRTLCREDCPGLCPSCGADRSVNSCDCETEAVDVRWAGLSALLPTDHE